MQSKHRPAVAVLWLLVLLTCATACVGPASGASPVVSEGKVPKGWREGGWSDWDGSEWARSAADFLNPVIDGLWTAERMQTAQSPDQPVSQDFGDRGVSDPEPAAVPAEAVPTPYQDTAPVIGKLFFDTPDGPSVCSATVVKDPARPDASDMVWTAGHCVHAGAEGGWYRNIVFVPSYNDEGLSGAARQGAGEDAIAPFGMWWIDWAETSPQWIETGTAAGGEGSPFDFAVLHVRQPDGIDAASLEEAAGGAAAISFDAPSTADISTIGLWGYPAAPPFDGERMFTCRGRPGRLSIDDKQPSLYRIGCTMTGGSSGGGWFIQDAQGLPVLVSNTSIGPTNSTWLAGPRLGADAESILKAVSDRFA